MNLAPIAFFAYKRPEHTLKALTALSECSLAQDSILFIYCDGPKRPEDRVNVEKVRNIVASKLWCGEVNIVLREENLGLANSIIQEVTAHCDESGKIIVLEDDLLVAKGFLSYMNRALVMYEPHYQVMQISGHVFPFAPDCGEYDAFFMPLSTTWGWATWKRAWECFDVNAVDYELLGINEGLRKNFDLDNSYPYSTMLFEQMSGAIDSWGIRWWWTFFNQKGLCLYPKLSLIDNIGFDCMASHTTGKLKIYGKEKWTNERAINRLPETIEVNRYNFDLLKKYFRNSNKEANMFKRTIHRLHRWVNK